MAMGRVSVFIPVAPASVTVAPNSPAALAHARIAEAMSPFLARGRVILKKACHLLQPSVRATVS